MRSNVRKISSPIKVEKNLSRLYNQRPQRRELRHIRFLSIYLRRRHFPYKLERIVSNQPYYTTLVGTTAGQRSITKRQVFEN